MPSQLPLHQTLAACLLALLLPSGVARADQPTAPRPPDFGRQWVRAHPVTIMGLCQTERTFDPAEYQAAGLNTLLAWKPRSGLLGPATQAGLPHVLHLSARDGLTAAFQSSVRKFRSDYPGRLGVLINDEPSLKALPATRAVLDWLRTTDPQALALSNAFPIGGTSDDYAGEPRAGYGYSDYLRDFVDILQPDVLMFDIYPFSNDSGSGVSDVYFQNLAMVREQALRARIPYWVFVQSYQSRNRRLPSESDLRMQAFSSLTYGFTGLAYFTYDAAFERGLLEPGGEPTSLYRPAAQLNAEVARLGRCLRFLTSTDVRYVVRPGEKPRRVTGLTWETGAGGDHRLEAVEVAAEGLGHGGLIGHFRDDQREPYFLLMNLNQHSDKSAADCRATFRLRFAPDVTRVLKLSRQTGRAEPIAIADPAAGLAVELEGGSGDLFKYDTGPFAGMREER